MFNKDDLKEVLTSIEVPDIISTSTEQATSHKLIESAKELKEMGFRDITNVNEKEIMEYYKINNKRT